MIEENYHPNVTQERPVGWRNGVYTASQPAATVGKSSDHSNDSRTTVPQTQPNPKVSANVDNPRMENPKSVASSDSLSNTTKIVPRFKPTFKAKAVGAYSHPQQQLQRQISGPKTVPTFKATNHPPRPLSSERPSQPPNFNSGQHRSATKNGQPSKQTPNFQINDDPDILQLTPTKPSMKPTFPAAKFSATTPRFTPKLPIPAQTVGTPGTKSKMPVKTKVPSTPKQRKPKTPPTTPKLTPTRSLSDSGLGSSILSTPVSSTPILNTQGIETSQNIIYPTPGTPVGKRPMDPASINFKLQTSVMSETSIKAFFTRNVF